MLLLIALSCLLCTVATAFTDGLLRNGEFEQGPKPSQLQGTRVIGRDAIPEWEISGYVEYIPSGHKQGDMILVVPVGSYAVRLGNGAKIKQRVKLEKGMHYALTFSTARTCAQNEQLNVSVTSDWGVVPVQTVYSSNGWDSYAWGWKSVVEEAEIVIHNVDISEDPACGPLVDSVAIKALHPPRPTNKNMLRNGDFEEGPYILPNTTWGVLIPPHVEDENSPLPGWIVESLKAVNYIDSPNFAIPKGKFAVELVGGMESSLAQVVRTVLGKSYELTFTVGDAGNACVGSLAIQAFAGRNVVTVPYESKGKGGAKRAMLVFTAVSERTRVEFMSLSYNMRSDDLSSLCGPVLDDVVLVGIRRKPRRLM